MAGHGIGKFGGMGGGENHHGAGAAARHFRGRDGHGGVRIDDVAGFGMDRG